MGVLSRCPSALLGSWPQVVAARWPLALLGLRSLVMEALRLLGTPRLWLRLLRALGRRLLRGRSCWRSFALHGETVARLALARARSPYVSSRAWRPFTPPRNE